MDEWIAEMSSYLKEEDPNHLVSPGTEGFFDESSPHRKYNPWECGWGLDTPYGASSYQPYCDNWPTNTGQVLFFPVFELTWIELFKKKKKD